MSYLVPVQEAQETILSQVKPLPAETVPLTDAYGRTTATDLTSDIDVSPFDNSAMDGFAFRASDVAGASEAEPAQLRIVAHIAAGDWYNQEVQPGQCVRIMTGAPIPESADAVVKYELVDVVSGDGRKGSRVAFSNRANVGDSIRIFVANTFAGAPRFEMLGGIEWDTSRLAEGLLFVKAIDAAVAAIVSEQQPANIYDVRGRLVRPNATSTEGLAPGVYISRGRKFVVK